MQSLTVSREAPPYVIPASVAIQDQFFLVTCLGLVFLNFLTFAYHLTGSTLFNMLSNAVSLLLISYSVYVVLVGREEAVFTRSFWYSPVFSSAQAMWPTMGVLRQQLP